MILRRHLLLELWLLLLLGQRLVDCFGLHPQLHCRRRRGAPQLVVPHHHKQQPLYYTTGPSLPSNVVTTTTPTPPQQQQHQQQQSSVSSSSSSSSYYQYVEPDELMLLKESVDIIEVAESLGLEQLERRGPNKATALCPFHDDHNPSLNLDSSRGFYKCFACGAGGDVFSLVQHFHQELSFPQAIRFVQKEYCSSNDVDDQEFLTTTTKYNLPTTTTQQRSASFFVDPKTRERLYAANVAAAAFYVDHLVRRPCGGGARQYLIVQRRLRPAILHQFSLGYAPDAYYQNNNNNNMWGEGSLVQHLQTLNFTADELVQAGLAVVFQQKKKLEVVEDPQQQQQQLPLEYSAIMDRFRGRIMVPILDVTGTRVLGFGGRLLLTPHQQQQRSEETTTNHKYKNPKYLNTPETPIFRKSTILFGQQQEQQQQKDSRTNNNNNKRTTTVVVVVEGYMDAIALTSVGISNVVATMGTAISMTQLELAASSSSLNNNSGVVMLWLDHDTAGQMAMERLCSQGMFATVLRQYPHVQFQIVSAATLLSLSSLSQNQTTESSWKDPSDYVEYLLRNHHHPTDISTHIQTHVFDTAVPWSRWYMQGIVDRLQLQQPSEEENDTTTKNNNETTTNTGGANNDSRTLQEVFHDLASFLSLFSSSEEQQYKLARFAATALIQTKLSESSSSELFGVQNQLESDLLDLACRIQKTRTPTTTTASGGLGLDPIEKLSRRALKKKQQQQPQRSGTNAASFFVPPILTDTENEWSSPTSPPIMDPEHVSSNKRRTLLPKVPPVLSGDDNDDYESYSFPPSSFSDMEGEPLRRIPDPMGYKSGYPPTWNGGSAWENERQRLVSAAQHDDDDNDERSPVRRRQRRPSQQQQQQQRSIDGRTKMSRKNNSNNKRESPPPPFTPHFNGFAFKHKSDQEWLESMEGGEGAKLVLDGTFLPSSIPGSSTTIRMAANSKNNKNNRFASFKQRKKELVYFNSNLFHGKEMLTLEARQAGYIPKQFDAVNKNNLTKQEIFDQGVGVLIEPDTDAMTLAAEHALLRALVLNPAARTFFKNWIQARTLLQNNKQENNNNDDDDDAVVKESSSLGFEWSTPEKEWLFQILLNDSNISSIGPKEPGKIRDCLMALDDVPNGALSIDDDVDSESSSFRGGITPSFSLSSSSNRNRKQEGILDALFVDATSPEEELLFNSFMHMEYYMQDQLGGLAWAAAKRESEAIQSDLKRISQETALFQSYVDSQSTTDVSGNSTLMVAMERSGKNNSTDDDSLVTEARRQELDSSLHYQIGRLNQVTRKLCSIKESTRRTSARALDANNALKVEGRVSTTNRNKLCSEVEEFVMTLGRRYPAKVSSWELRPGEEPYEEALANIDASWGEWSDEDYMWTKESSQNPSPQQKILYNPQQVPVLFENDYDEYSGESLEESLERMDNDWADFLN